MTSSPFNRSTVYTWKHVLKASRVARVLSRFSFFYASLPEAETDRYLKSDSDAGRSLWLACRLSIIFVKDFSSRRRRYSTIVDANFRSWRNKRNFL